MQTQAKKAKFRFQDLKIWQLAMEIANELCDLADELENKKLFRFAEQIRGASMSMPNNIAEGSGSTSKKEFMQFLNIARRSTFENANILTFIANAQFDNKLLFGPMVRSSRYALSTNNQFQEYSQMIIAFPYALCPMLSAKSRLT